MSTANIENSRVKQKAGHIEIWNAGIKKYSEMLQSVMLNCERSLYKT